MSIKPRIAENYLDENSINLWDQLRNRIFKKNKSYHIKMDYTHGVKHK